MTATPPSVPPVSSGPAGAAPPAPPVLPVRGGALKILLLSSTLTVMAGAMIVPVLDVIRGALGVGSTEAGLIITTHGLSLALASPFAGWLIDRYGIRAPLGAGLVLYGLVGGAGLFLNSYPALLASRFLFGIAAAAVFSGTTLALLTYYRGPDQDRVMGWRTTALSAGGVIWPLMAGAIGGLSWHAPFALYVIGVPLGLAVLVVLPRYTPVRAVGRADRVWPMLRRSRLLLGSYGLLGTGSLLLFVTAVFVPLRLAEIGVRTPFIVAIVGVTVSVAGSVTGMFYARLKARLGYTGVLRLSMASWAAAFALIGVVGNAPLVAVALAGFGVGMGLATPALMTLINESAPPALRGRAAALSGTAIFAGQFLSPVVFGPIADATTIQIAFLAAAALAAAMLLAMLTRRVPDPAPR